MDVSIENGEAVRSFALIGFLIVSLIAGVALIFIGISRLWGAILLILGVLSLIRLLHTHGSNESFWLSALSFILMIIGILIGGVIAGLFVLAALFFPVI